MSIVLNDNLYEIPGLETESFKDTNSKLYKQKTIHGKERDTWIRGIVIHTNRGQVPGTIIPRNYESDPRLRRLFNGLPKDGRDIALARYQANSSRVAGWDYTVDARPSEAGGLPSVAVSNDPFHMYAYHAGTVNKYTVGIEMVQGTDRPYNMYDGTYTSTLVLIDYLTARLGIQRQIMCGVFDEDGNFTKEWIEGVIPGRLQSPNDRKRGSKSPTGMDVCGIYGHRNITTNKGPGDPGNQIFDKLLDAGYEVFDIRSEQDMKVWKQRQEEVLGIEFVEMSDITKRDTPTAKAIPWLDNSYAGIPDPHVTRRRIAQVLGKPYGMWVQRPIDKLLMAEDAKNGFPKSHVDLFTVPFEHTVI